MTRRGGAVGLYKTDASPKAMAGNIPVFCAHDEIVSLEKLVPNPKNPNEHPDDQVDLLAKIIKATGWRQPITVSKRSGFVVKGHGRLLAAIRGGMTSAPVDYQEYASEAEEYADLVADNRLAELSEINNAKLASIFKEIDFDKVPIDLTGYSEAEMQEIFNELEGVEDVAGLDGETYTDKTDIPQYEVTGKAVTIDECVYKDRANDFIREIETAEGLTDEERKFLELAATRFYAFNYKNVAEYYANTASPAMQRLMEKMALVIIDFDSAIKNGYVKLTRDLEAVVKNDNAD